MKNLVSPAVAGENESLKEKEKGKESGHVIEFNGHGMNRCVNGSVVQVHTKWNKCRNESNMLTESNSEKQEAFEQERKEFLAEKTRFQEVERNMNATVKEIKDELQECKRNLAKAMRQLAEKDAVIRVESVQARGEDKTEDVNTGKKMMVAGGKKSIIWTDTKYTKNSPTKKANRGLSRLIEDWKGTKDENHGKVINLEKLFPLAFRDHCQEGELRNHNVSERQDTFPSRYTQQRARNTWTKVSNAYTVDMETVENGSNTKKSKNSKKKNKIFSKKEKAKSNDKIEKESVGTFANWRRHFGSKKKEGEKHQKTKVGGVQVLECRQDECNEDEISKGRRLDNQSLEDLDEQGKESKTESKAPGCIQEESNYEHLNSFQKQEAEYQLIIRELREENARLLKENKNALSKAEEVKKSKEDYKRRLEASLNENERLKQERHLRLEEEKGKEILFEQKVKKLAYYKEKLKEADNSKRELQVKFEREIKEYKKEIELYKERSEEFEAFEEVKQKNKEIVRKLKEKASQLEANDETLELKEEEISNLNTRLAETKLNNEALKEKVLELSINEHSLEAKEREMETIKRQYNEIKCREQALQEWLKDFELQETELEVMAQESEKLKNENLELKSCKDSLEEKLLEFEILVENKDS